MTRQVIEQMREALDEAATSLETLSKLAGKKTFIDESGERQDTYLEHFDQVRGYANSRALMARQALSAAKAVEPKAHYEEQPDGTIIPVNPSEMEPQPEREWVELTDAQVDGIWLARQKLPPPQFVQRRAIYRAISAALRQKNGCA